MFPALRLGGNVGAYPERLRAVRANPQVKPFVDTQSQRMATCLIRMAKLADSRHESIARHLAKGRSQTEAHKLAGYAEDNGNASRLCTSNHIQARVEELKSAAARRAEVSVEWVLTRLKKHAASPDEKVAVKALELIAKHLGLFEHVKRSEITVTQQRELMARMPDSDFAELQKIMLRQMETKRD